MSALPFRNWQFVMEYSFRVTLARQMRLDVKAKDSPLNYQMNSTLLYDPFLYLFFLVIIGFERRVFISIHRGNHR